MGTLSRNIIMKVCALTISLVFFHLVINGVFSDRNKKKYYLVEVENKKGIKPVDRYRGGRDYELAQSDINELFQDTDWKPAEDKAGNKAKEEEESTEWKDVALEDGTETVEENPAKELEELFPVEDSTDKNKEEEEKEIKEKKKKKEEREKSIQKIISSIKKDMQELYGEIHLPDKEIRKVAIQRFEIEEKEKNETKGNE